MGCAGEKVRKRNRSSCVGDLRDRVVLHDRRLVEPVFGSSALSEKFTASQVAWAAVSTTTGKTLFDGVSTDRVITHEVLLRFDPCVTSETWLVIDSGHRLDVVKVEDLDERHEWLRLLCVDVGLADLAATRA